MASTDLRVAAQQALEALEIGYDSAQAEAHQFHAAMAGYKPQRHAAMDADVQKIARAITALKAALVEDAMQKFTDVNQELEAALAEPVQEPVAWALHTGTRQGIKWNRKVEHGAPLYTAPPQRPAEPVQEPVAYSVGRTLHWHQGRGVTDAQLYTSPPQRPAEPVQERDLAHEADMRRHAREQLRLDCIDEEESEHYCDTHCTWADHAPGCVMEERNFCPRCGKRANGIHTCTPPAPLTDEVIATLWHQNGGFHHHFARAIERWLRGHA